jgi:hypothetical protein
MDFPNPKNILKPIPLIAKESNISNPLTCVESGKLWATFLGNSMSEKIISYFLQHCEEDDIKTLLKNSLKLTREFQIYIKNIFNKESFPIPTGFTEDDVSLNAPRLFEDEFYVHYLKYVLKAGMSVYSIAIPILNREDVKEFFLFCLECTLDLLDQINNVLYNKGFGTRPPIIPIPKKSEMLSRDNFLNGYVGDIRPLHALEITHLYDNLENNTTSKALLLGFYQTVQDEKIKSLFKRGLNITQKTIQNYTRKLQIEHLQSPSLHDHLVTTSNVPPFSDKIMLFHKVDMFSMKIRAFGNSLAVNGRKDIGILYGKSLINNSLFVEDGANILIEKQWMESPPKAEKRERT